MSERKHYALAGLLHDIGKFGQRADGNYYNSEELSPQSKELADKICPKSKAGFYTHQHVIWTNDFLEKFKDKFKNASLYGNGENNMFNLACYHHLPSTLEQAIITMADHWSSGIDRNTEMVSEKIEKQGRYKFKTQPIVSIFNELRTNTSPNGIGLGVYGHDIEALSISDNIFPTQVSSLNISLKYKELYRKFENDFSKIKTTNDIGFIETVCTLLKMYTSYIPASTMDYPDSSLFEHMKITGAFADCFSAYLEEFPAAFSYSKGGKIKLNDNYFPVLMVCGDISGIQSFIYNISNKSAMKGLKGRSFYIQMMAEAYSRKILEQTGATQINSIYAAGGKFYLLLPNTTATNSILEEVSKEIQSALWKEHKGKLSLNIGKIAFKLKEFSGELKVIIDKDNDKFEIGELWKLLSEKTTNAKKIQFDFIIQNQFEQMFSPFGTGGDIMSCSVTGEELNSDESVQLQIEDIEQGDASNVVSPSVYNQIQIGSSLYGAAYLVKYKDEKKEGFTIPAAGNWQLIQKSDYFHSINSIIKIAFENNFIDLEINSEIEKNAGKSFRYYGGIQMAQINNKIATLEDLCKIDSGVTDKLGVLRMDVDFLGQLFMNGFQKETASFSKLASMSWQFDQFFSGYVNVLLKKESYSKNVNIIYSGGDDLFAVGRWDKIIDFSVDLRNDFKKFVCNRNDITLSAGVAIVGPRFPIAKAAVYAEDAEKMAKSHIYEGKEKDAINIFGISLNWEDEIPFVIEFKNDLINWIQVDKLISRGLLMKLFNYYDSYKLGNLDWRWQSAYTMSRYYKNVNNQDSRTVIEIIKSLLFTGKYKNQPATIRFEAIIAACRWAELLTKN